MQKNKTIYSRTDQVNYYNYSYTGPFVAVTSYLSEFHSAAHRSRVQLLRGTAIGVGGIIVPIIAWIVLPNSYEISITQNISKHITKIKFWSYYFNNI